MWTKPSVVPTKRFADPVHILERSLWIVLEAPLGQGAGGGLTLEIEELSSGIFTGDTSMKLNAFHYCC
jgi:hypothetical protein